MDQIHEVDPVLQICTRCLRSEKELSEKPEPCWGDDYLQWVRQQAVKMLSAR